MEEKRRNGEEKKEEWEKYGRERRKIGGAKLTRSREEERDKYRTRGRQRT